MEGFREESGRADWCDTVNDRRGYIDRLMHCLEQCDERLGKRSVHKRCQHFEDQDCDPQPDRSTYSHGSDGGEGLDCFDRQSSESKAPCNPSRIEMPRRYRDTRGVSIKTLKNRDSYSFRRFTIKLGKSK